MHVKSRIKTCVVYKKRDRPAVQHGLGTCSSCHNSVRVISTNGTPRTSSRSHADATGGAGGARVESDAAAIARAGPNGDGWCTQRHSDGQWVQLPCRGTIHKRRYGWWKRSSAKRQREAGEAAERLEQSTRQQARRTEIESQRSARVEASTADSDLPGAAVRGVVMTEVGRHNRAWGKDGT